MPAKIEIAGGGIGGLAAGAALARLDDVEVHVHEARPELREEGGGIALGENAFRALDALGVRTSYPRGEVITWEEVRDDGIPIHVGRTRGRFQWVPRTELHSALLDAARAVGATVEASSRVVGVTAGGELRTSDGEVRHGDLVVVADGIGSELRSCLDLGTRVRRLNHWGVRAPLAGELVEAREGCLYENWSGHLRVGFGRTGVEGAAVWFSWPSANGTLDPSAWKRAYPQLADLFERIFRDPPVPHHFGFVWCPRWSDGRAVLLGDAVHAMPPHMGQGGALALQDAATLGVALRGIDLERADALRPALEAWASARRRHAARVLRYALFFCSVQGMWPPPLTPLRARLLRTIYARVPAASHEPGRELALRA